MKPEPTWKEVGLFLWNRLPVGLFWAYWIGSVAIIIWAMS